MRSPVYLLRLSTFIVLILSGLCSWANAIDSQYATTDLAPVPIYRVVDGVRVIEKQYISDTVTIDGPEWNRAIIRNNVFSGQGKTGLHISNVSDLKIENNEFFGMASYAIKLRDYENQGTHNVQIMGNYFHDLQTTAILVGEPNYGIKIIGNSFKNVAYDINGNKKHAMYIKGPDFLVEGNRIDGVGDAHGISVRSSGVVRGNVVQGAGEDGIKYYSSSMKKGSGQLVIENNVLFNNTHGGIVFDAGKGIMIDNVIVRFNTLVNNYRSIRIKEEVAQINFQVYGNLIVERTGKYYSLEIEPRLMKYNLASSSDIGFVDLFNNNFQLLDNSQAKGSVRKVPGLPPYDFSKNSMGSRPYDAGAYQVQDESIIKKKGQSRR